MNDASFEECMESNAAKRITPDKGRALSLQETAKARLSLIKGVDERNCNFVFEDYYTSTLEILHARALGMGYGVSNHVCLGYFLRDVLKKEEFYPLFDDVRKKRNGLTYYGFLMDLETAKGAIEKCKRLMRGLKEFG